ncbi:SDR family NAD(P)-dependent oxidoreductase [Caulobacter sp. CCNWLY153]|uniref:Short-chain dehydrogenase n=1 Tax=Caulobacter radicis TaxID=2172650 RepID=A0A2T9JM49_9CAUL|nr:SDR family NAD(P)-dependent oxidoreductase [Caulobacter radicis]PVM84779.1 short-chain dehydrogenase [Caulobacter radicis]
MARKVWFITGVSRGLGLALAQTALAAGHMVIGTTRDGVAPEGLSGPRLNILALEATDLEGVALVVNQAHALHGRLDVVVNNAGYGLIGPIEAASAQEIERQFTVNVFAPLAVLRAALPHMRARGRGHILNISSVAAIAPAPGAGLYAASKSALWALTQSLAQEAAPFGIWTTTVSPGPFRTDFLSDHSMRRTAATIPAYEASASGQATQALMARAGVQAGDPAKAARAILEIVEADEPPVDLLLGAAALTRARARLDRFDEDAARWEVLTRAADFTD